MGWLVPWIETEDIAIHRESLIFVDASVYSRPRPERGYTDASTKIRYFQ